jgi:hypothetical protein
MMLSHVKIIPERKNKKLLGGEVGRRETGRDRNYH